MGFLKTADSNSCEGVRVKLQGVYYGRDGETNPVAGRWDHSNAASGGSGFFCPEDKPCCVGTITPQCPKESKGIKGICLDQECDKVPNFQELKSGKDDCKEVLDTSEDNKAYCCY